MLMQDGVKVAPFKAQNMALNSFVTADGGEMGRSQATQAAACGLAPDVRMNPLLLKPMGGVGCQVILEGKVRGTWTASEQAVERAELERAIDRCYASLADEFDAIVLEGAGSPAEVNLKDRDIVNMAMARKANAPVLLVGDIDRGGVFAALLGTMEIFEEWERELVAGFVINRLHGGASSLKPALDYIENRCGKPVFGVVPFLKDLHLPEEDSVSFRSGRYAKIAERPDAVEIAVVELPHISNFTDIDPLVIEPDVSIRTVSRVRDLGMPDVVIIPGSKNTVADLHSLVGSGLARAVKEHAGRGGFVVGLCAGMQMLGSRVLDNADVEGGTACGLGLLPVETEMLEEKALRQTTTLHEPSGFEVRGYEIHHGSTKAIGAVKEIMYGCDQKAIGYSSPNGKIWGTYLHGVFSDDRFRRWFIDVLRRGRGFSPLGEPQCEYGLESSLDRLAASLREHLPVDRIYQVMGL